MIKKIASLLLATVCGSQFTDAKAGEAAPQSTDHWVIYERVAPDGKPLVVVARNDSTASEEIQKAKRASVVICVTDPANVNEQGMPQGTDLLYPLDDKLNEAPALLAAGAVLVASVTGHGERRMFFVHRNELDFSPVLQSNQVQGFSCHGVELTDRQTFSQLITPTQVEIQLSGDREVIANLKKNNDDGLASRKTDFWFYGSNSALGVLVTELTSRGFSVDHWLSKPSGVVLSRQMPVDFATFSAITPVLVDATVRVGARYDGWETVVVRQGMSRR